MRHLARLVDARYFEYLLTRFSEPNEIFGPIDIKAFREGTYVRRVEAMLPDADIVFLDEIFKSNSAILNSLLSILNERRFFTGSASIQVPLSSLYGATNEVPNDDALGAVFDRFLVRTLSDNLDSFHFHGLVERGLRGEIEALARDGGARARRRSRRAPLVSLAEIRTAQARLAQHPAVPRGLPGPLQGPRLPDPLGGRDAQRSARRQAAEAVRGQRARRRAADRRRRRLLRPAPHLEQRRPDPDRSRTSSGRCWSSTTASIPRRARAGRRARDLDGILAELGVIRGLLLGGEPLSDVQLFSQLRNLQEIRAALQAIGTDTAQPMAGEVDKLLEGVFESSKWSG